MQTHVSTACKIPYFPYLYMKYNSNTAIICRYSKEKKRNHDYPLQAEEVRQGLNYALRHALACTINCVLLAITHAYKCSWQLKPRFSCYFTGGSEGLSRSKGLLFEGKNHGPKDRAELQEYIGEPLARSTVDAFSDGRKC